VLKLGKVKVNLNWTMLFTLFVS